MNGYDHGSKALSVLGIVLVVSGVWIVLGALLWPLAHVLKWVVAVAWPLILIALGVYFVTRGRRRIPEPESPSASPVYTRRAYRSETDRVFAGVLGGFAEYLNLDSTLVRVGYVLFTVFSGFGPGILLYIVALVLMPRGRYGEAVSYRPAPSVPSAPPVPPRPANQ